MLHFAAKGTPERHKVVSTERAQHTEIPLPRDKEPLLFGSTRAKFARGSRAQSIPSLKEKKKHSMRSPYCACVRSFNL
jgi:hypothetical protein